MPPRPPIRRAIRRAFKVLGLRRYSHWEEGWPHLTLDRPGPAQAGAVRWRGRAVAPLLSAATLAERMGEEVAIFGSGPSLRGQDLSSVPPGAALLVNGAISLAPRLGGTPTAPILAMAIEDERFVWAHHAMIREHLPLASLCILSPAAMRALMSIEPDLLPGRDILLIDNLRRPWRGRRRRGTDMSDLSPLVVQADGAALSTDPGRGVVAGGTVAFTAMQFALAAGPRRIGLAGIDIANADQPRFYENGADRQPTAIKVKQDLIVAHFALAAREAAGRGVAVECYSPVSALLGVGIPYTPRLQSTDGQ